jgi:hypothetical protein
VQVIQRAYAGREAPELLLAGRIVAHTRRAICRHCICTAVTTNSHRCSHVAINTAAAHGNPLSEPITNVDWLSRGADATVMAPPSAPRAQTWTREWAVQPRRRRSSLTQCVVAPRVAFMFKGFAYSA